MNYYHAGRILQYRQTSLNMSDRDQKICLACKEFTHKKTNDDHKLMKGSLKKDDSQSNIREFADKKTAYNEVHLYLLQCL